MNNRLPLVQIITTLFFLLPLSLQSNPRYFRGTLITPRVQRIINRPPMAPKKRCCKKGYAVSALPPRRHIDRGFDRTTTYSQTINANPISTISGSDTQGTITSSAHRQVNAVHSNLPALSQTYTALSNELDQIDLEVGQGIDRLNFAEIVEKIIILKESGTSNLKPNEQLLFKDKLHQVETMLANKAIRLVLDTHDSFNLNTTDTIECDAVEKLTTVLMERGIPHLERLNCIACNTDMKQDQLLTARENMTVLYIWCKNSLQDIAQKIKKNPNQAELANTYQRYFSITEKLVNAIGIPLQLIGTTAYPQVYQGSASLENELTCYEKQMTTLLGNNMQVQSTKNNYYPQSTDGLIYTDDSDHKNYTSDEEDEEEEQSNGSYLNKYMVGGLTGLAAVCAALYYWYNGSSSSIPAHPPVTPPTPPAPLSVPVASAHTTTWAEKAANMIPTGIKNFFGYGSQPSVAQATPPLAASTASGASNQSSATNPTWRLDNVVVDEDIFEGPPLTTSTHDITNMPNNPVLTTPTVTVAPSLINTPAVTTPLTTPTASGWKSSVWNTGSTLWNKACAVAGYNSSPTTAANTTPVTPSDLIIIEDEDSDEEKSDEMDTANNVTAGKENIVKAPTQVPKPAHASTTNSRAVQFAAHKHKIGLGKQLQRRKITKKEKTQPAASAQPVMPTALPMTTAVPVATSTTKKRIGKSLKPLKPIRINALPTINEVEEDKISMKSVDSEEKDISKASHTHDRQESNEIGTNQADTESKKDSIKAPHFTSSSKKIKTLQRSRPMLVQDNGDTTVVDLSAELLYTPALEQDKAGWKEHVTTKGKKVMAQGLDIAHTIGSTTLSAGEKLVTSSAAAVNEYTLKPAATVLAAGYNTTTTKIASVKNTTAHVLSASVQTARNYTPDAVNNAASRVYSYVPSFSSVLNWGTY